MATNDSTATKSDVLSDLNRVRNILDTIRDAAEQMEFDPGSAEDVLRAALSIAGMAIMGEKLSNRALSNVENMEVTP